MNQHIFIVAKPSIEIHVEHQSVIPNYISEKGVIESFNRHFFKP